MSELTGVCGCLLPTLTNDYSGINEVAIRHDARRQLELGFSGALLVSECGTTPQEMRQFVDVAVDEVGSRLSLVLQASEPTLEATLDLVKYGEDAGVDLVLLSYPHSFYAQTTDDIIGFTRAVADSTSLGIIIFALDMWNFGRLHPSGFAVDWLEQLVDLCPNVVAIKNEVGPPGVAGTAEVFHRLKDRVIVADPLEENAPAWTSTFGMRWMGTSNYEYYGAEIPRMFALLQNPGRFNEAMALYWRLHPARQVALRVSAGTGMIPRPLWKYQGWLNGFNGGPIRPPQVRLKDHQMVALRRALVDCGLPVTDSQDPEFFVGRYPK
jgi:4-hydroxy-tetrahydrodipicolinate synthase